MAAPLPILVLLLVVVALGMFEVALADAIVEPLLQLPTLGALGVVRLALLADPLVAHHGSLRLRGAERCGVENRERGREHGAKDAGAHHSPSVSQCRIQ